MNPSLHTALNDQANQELSASHAYHAMALWCADKDYLGYAEFFLKQAAEEREHAGRFLKHLADRGVMPELKSVEAPRTQFERLRDIAEHAAVLERRNTDSISRCYELALEVRDYASQPMLLEFIEEQVEEEAWASTMVTLTRRAECSGAVYNLDRHIVKTLITGEPAPTEM